MGVVWTFLLSSILSPLSPSLWETARYRLKYCLKGPLNPKQPTNPKEQKQKSLLGTASNKITGGGGGVELVCGRPTLAVASALVYQTKQPRTTKAKRTEDSFQTGRTPKLIRVFGGCKFHLILSCPGSNDPMGVCHVVALVYLCPIRVNINSIYWSCCGSVLTVQTQVFLCI